MIDGIQYIASVIIHGIAIMLWQRGASLAAIALTAAGLVFLFTT